MKKEFKKSLIFKLVLLLLLTGGYNMIGSAQDYYALDSTQLKNHLKVLASDAMEGRETGQKGQKKAADYIQYYMKNNNLLPLDKNNSYYQEFIVSYVNWDTIAMSVDGENMDFMEDYVAPPHPNSDMHIVADELLFLGYGIDEDNYSDYARNDVKGKTILIRQGEPINRDGDYVITESNEPSQWSDGIEYKLKIANSHGVASVLIIAEDIREIVKQYQFELFRGTVIDSVPHVMKEMPPYAFISEDYADKILKKKQKRAEKYLKKSQKRKKLKAVRIKKADIELLGKKNIEYVHTENVAGLLEGDDPVDDGYIIVTAHYDHLGVRGSSIYNGADDNGSGTAALLTMMNEFFIRSAYGKRNKKPILFIFMTGEEKGLLGSRYYVENPLLPLENAYANVNIDMIGRKDDAHENGDYIYVIGSDKISTSLDDLIQEVHEDYEDFQLDYTFNSDDDPNRFYYRSDHYSFARKGIPVVFFFSGVHEDYHMPSDTIEKILFPAMTNRTQFIFEVIKAAAQRDNPFLKDVD